MNHYEFDKETLKSLRELLVQPLMFDPKSYFRNYAIQSGVTIDLQLIKFASFYNICRKKLILKKKRINYLLSIVKKPTESIFTKKSFPINYFFEEGTVLSRLNDTSELNVIYSKNIDIQIDRLLDSFSIKKCKNKEYNKELSEVIIFFYISEILYFSLIGMTEIEFIGNEIHITVKEEESKKEFHRKWFANFYEEQSNEASVLHLNENLLGLKKNNDFNSVIFELSRYLRDKIFSIESKKLENEIENLPSVIWPTKICFLIVICYWSILNSKNGMVRYELLKKFPITDKEINLLNNISKNQLYTDRLFLFKQEGISIRLKGLVHQARNLLIEILKVQPDGSNNHKIGDYFEKEYVMKYLENNLRENYTLFKGIKKSHVENKDKYEKLDVDFIIKDVEYRKYYFVQVKYCRAGGKAYLEGDLDYLCNDNITKGIRQLIGAKQALNSEDLSKILKDRGLQECNESNTEFILIHNIYNFDFSIWPSGIISYDWNTFRNLCMKGSVKIEEDGERFSFQQKNNLPIYNPDETISFIRKNSPDSQSKMFDSLFEVDNLLLEMNINDRKLQIKGIGT